MYPLLYLSLPIFVFMKIGHKQDGNKLFKQHQETKEVRKYVEGQISLINSGIYYILSELAPRLIQSISQVDIFVVPSVGDRNQEHWILLVNELFIRIRKKKNILFGSFQLIFFFFVLFCFLDIFLVKQPCMQSRGVRRGWVCRFGLWLL